MFFTYFKFPAIRLTCLVGARLGGGFWIEVDLHWQGFLSNIFLSWILRYIDIDNEGLGSYLSSVNVSSQSLYPNKNKSQKKSSWFTQTSHLVHTAALWKSSTKLVHRNRIIRASSCLCGLPLGCLFLTPDTKNTPSKAWIPSFFSVVRAVKKCTQNIISSFSCSSLLFNVF